MNNIDNINDSDTQHSVEVGKSAAGRAILEGVAGNCHDSAAIARGVFAAMASRVEAARAGRQYEFVDVQTADGFEPFELGEFSEEFAGVNEIDHAHVSRGVAALVDGFLRGAGVRSTRIH